MNYTTRLSGVPKLVGTHHTAGSDYLYFVRNDPQNQGVHRIRISAATLTHKGHVGAPSPGELIDLVGVGDSAVRWMGDRLAGVFGSRVVALPKAQSIDEITLDQLIEIPWDDLSIDAAPEALDPTLGSLCGVRLPARGEGFNHAVVHVGLHDGVVHVDWLAYLIARPMRVSALGGDLRDLVVSKGETAIYLSGIDLLGTHFVGRIQRTVDGHRPEYSSLYLEPLNTLPLVEPQQIALDGGDVYVVDMTSVWRIDPDGNQTKVLDGLAGGVGLLVDRTASSIRVFATDQAGQIHRAEIPLGFPIDVVALEPPPKAVKVLSADAPLLADASAAPAPELMKALPVDETLEPAPVYPKPIGPTPIGPTPIEPEPIDFEPVDPKLLAPPSSGFLCWADDQHTAFYMTVPAKKQIVRVDVLQKSISTLLFTPLPPRSVERLAPHRLHMSSTAELGDISLSASAADAEVSGLAPLAQ